MATLQHPSSNSFRFSDRQRAIMEEIFLSGIKQIDYGGLATILKVKKSHVQGWYSRRRRKQRDLDDGNVTTGETQGAAPTGTSETPPGTQVRTVAGAARGTSFRFNAHQLGQMEAIFLGGDYNPDYDTLAAQLGVKKQQVQGWYSRRRRKQRDLNDGNVTTGGTQAVAPTGTPPETSPGTQVRTVAGAARGTSFRFNADQLGEMEAIFLGGDSNPRPDYGTLATQLGVKKKQVQCWFCRRRRKQRDFEDGKVADAPVGTAGGTLREPGTPPAPARTTEHTAFRFDTHQREQMEAIFLHGDHNPADYDTLASQFGAKKQQVQGWFRRRRDKQRKVEESTIAYPPEKSQFSTDAEIDNKQASEIHVQDGKVQDDERRKNEDSRHLLLGLRPKTQDQTDRRNLRRMELELTTLFEDGDYKQATQLQPKINKLRSRLQEKQLKKASTNLCNAITTRGGLCKRKEILAGRCREKTHQCQVFEIGEIPESEETKTFESWKPYRNRVPEVTTDRRYNTLISNDRTAGNEGHGCIYMFRLKDDGDDNWWKIGVTNDLRRRKKEHEANFRKLDQNHKGIVVKSWPGAGKQYKKCKLAEAVIHARLQNVRYKIKYKKLETRSASKPPTSGKEWFRGDEKELTEMVKDTLSLFEMTDCI